MFVEQSGKRDLCCRKRLGMAVWVGENENK